MDDMNQTKILVAEDNEILLKSVSRFISQNGYIPLQAGDGHEALEIFRQEQPALILTDLRMPLMSGFELLNIVAIESPKTPVIIFSGVGEQHDVIKAFRYGAVDYIAKPVEDVDFLINRIEIALLKAQCRDNSDLTHETGVWSFSHATIEAIQFNSRKTTQ